MHRRYPPPCATEIASSVPPFPIVVEHLRTACSVRRPAPQPRGPLRKFLRQPMASKNDPPAPPYSTGISIPISPNWNSCGNKSAEKCCSSSICRTSGPMVCCENSRTLDRNNRSSSFRWVRGQGMETATASGGMRLLNGRKTVEFSTWEGVKTERQSKDEPLRGSSDVQKMGYPSDKPVPDSQAGLSDRQGKSSLPPSCPIRARNTG